jgi:hypothetical protein
MKKMITGFSVHETAKICGLLYGIFGVVFGVIFFLATVDESVGGALAMLLGMPLLYGGLGYVGTALFAWLYNFISRKFNAGITFEMKDVE